MWVQVTDGEFISEWESFYVRSISGTRLTAFGDNDVFFGSSASERISAQTGDDVIYSGGGNDTIFGADGADIFIFEADSAFTGEDSIRNFDDSDGDALDISDILEGYYDPGTDILTEFVQFVEEGYSTVVRVDQNGGGDNFVDIAVLQGVTGLGDEQTLVTNQTLIVE